MRRLTVLMLVLLAGCSTAYRVPDVSRGGPIRGVEHYLAETGTVRMLMSHGMCSDTHRARDHPGDPDRVNWVALRAGQIARALGYPYRPEPVYTPVATYGEGPAKVERYVVTLRDPDGGATVEATFLIWGRLVDSHREALAFENTRRADDPDAPRRAPVNAALKRELMNRCLIDAVVYLGTSGDAIRRGMREAVCATLGGRFAPSRPVAGRAGSPARCSDVAPSGQPLVLVPESLGSAVLLDALTDLTDAGTPVAGALRQDIRAVFLASHQIPLLAQGNAAPGAVVRAAEARARPGDPLTRFLGAVEAGPRFLERSAAPIQIVSITDPNDVLGYRLALDRYDPARFEPRNVLVSNAGAFLGLVSNPIDAHRNTARPQVFRIIARGLPAP